MKDKQKTKKRKHPIRISRVLAGLAFVYVSTQAIFIGLSGFAFQLVEILMILIGVLFLTMGVLLIAEPFMGEFGEKIREFERKIGFNRNR